MGWGNCGTDSKGRPIGYVHAGTCDEPGCEVEIDRGLGYACGGMHGTKGRTTNDDEEADVCEGYFCGQHLFFAWTRDPDPHDEAPCLSACRPCKTAIESDWRAAAGATAQ